MDIQNVSIDAVIPYARNPRHNKEAVSKVAGSIKEYGFRQPIVVDEQMVIIAGHTRLLAAQQLGLAEVPVHIATGLSDVQIKAYRLADNKTAEFSEWDEELLALELEELQKQGCDLDLTAFDSIDIDRLLASLEDEDMVSAEEFVPEIPDEPITKTGDIWQLGNHRLLCGDATDSACYSKLIGDEMVDMLFTDPPYNVDYQGTAGKIANDAMSDADFLYFLQKAFCCAYNVLDAGAAFYVCYGDKEAINFRSALEHAKFKISSCIIWKKNQFVLGRLDYSDVAGNYPAVGQLVTLAATVKTIMGGGTQITYAADWSEYHSIGGWFNLDPLWASANIDFVGIDSYFPLTEDLPQIQIDEQAITDGWECAAG